MSFSSDEGDRSWDKLALRPAARVNEPEKTKPSFVGDPPSPETDVVLEVDTGMDQDVFVPACTAKWLREYQLEGVAFLYNAYKERTGVILGDDMGLGKTAQCIVFLNAIFCKKSVKTDLRLMRDRRTSGLPHPRALIICPKGLIGNWQHELDVWSFTHCKYYHGAQRESTLAQAKQGLLEVMLVTYDTYRSDADDINLVPWDVVIADEFHQIKNSKSGLYQAFMKMETSVRIGLSGTPIQNRYSELYALLDWLCPGQIANSTEWAALTAKLNNGRRQNSTNAEVASGTEATLVLRKIMSRKMLRRMKTLLGSQLPNKSDFILFCPLVGLQAEAYHNIASSDIVQALCQNIARDGVDVSKGDMFRYISIMRQLAQHLSLLFPRSEDGPERQQSKRELLEVALPGRWQAIAAQGSNVHHRNEGFCGKWRTLRKLLQVWHSESNANNKVIIFSSSVQLLEMLQSILETERYTFEVLTGKHSQAERQEALDNFNNNPDRFIFLISTGVGAVGLNITSANKCVIFNPDWNPTKDLQAQDRAYRIGQKRDVTVYRLISVGTIEELIYARQIYKQQQAELVYENTHQRRHFDGVMDDKHQHGELFGLTNLLTYTGSSHVVRRIFQKTSVAERNFDLDMAELSLKTVNDDATGDDATNHRTEADEINEAIQDFLPSQKAVDQTTLAIMQADEIDYVQNNADALSHNDTVRRMEDRAAALAQDPAWAHRRADGADQAVMRKGVQVGNLPADMLRRHFVSLARANGFADPAAFGLKVTRMSYDENSRLLHKFYSSLPRSKEEDSDDALSEGDLCL